MVVDISNQIIKIFGMIFQLSLIIIMLIKDILVLLGLPLLSRGILGVGVGVGVMLRLGLPLLLRLWRLLCLVLRIRIGDGRFLKFGM